jgi:cytochrome c2
MLKISVVLGALGLGLLLLSVVPLPGQIPQAANTIAAPTSVAIAPTDAPSIAPPSVAASLTEAEYGQALFLAKGCVSCHHHAAVAGMGGFTGAQGADGAPDLSRYQPAPDFVRTWLKDPQAVRPATKMPNLGLHKDEIEALIAFLAVEP